ncbi:amino acid adenylation domain-containing protein [Streptomyces sp. BH055]|uniref:amino acid adenylation domain-containing protein n=1 Tax=Streptomyces sp. BH055 TaxID=3401173 RepID=UPI003BB56780
MNSSGVSSAQEAMWLEQDLAPEQPNSTTTLWSVRGEFEAGIFQDALKEAVAEADALLVNFRRENGELRLVTREPDAWEPFRVDVRDAAAPAHAARAFLTDQVSRPFDLAVDPLFRLGTIRLADEHHLICLILHHIVTDAFGVFSLFSQRIAAIYRSLRSGAPVLERASTPPGVAAEVEAEYRASRSFAAAEEFWRRYVEEAGTAAQLPRGLRAAPGAAETGPAPEAATAEGLRFWDSLSTPLGAVSHTAAVAASEVAGWAKAAETTGTTVPDLLTAAATAFCARLCNTTRPLFSFSVNHRSGRIRNALGMYSNALPLAVEVPPSATFVELAQLVRAERLRVLPHADHNVSLIKRAVGRAGDTRSPFGPLVSVVPFLRELDLAGAVGRFVAGTLGLTDEVRIATYGDGGPDSDLYIRCDAPSALYDAQDLAGLSARFVAFVRAALAVPQARVQDVPVTGEAERAGLLERGKGPAAEGHAETMRALLEERCAAAPQAVAVVHGESELTYGELAAGVERLGRRLRACGAGPGHSVAVSLPRSIESVLACCAVLHVGAALLPIDPDCPSDRVLSLLAEARPTLLLTAAGNGVGITPLDGTQPQWESSVMEPVHPTETGTAPDDIPEAPWAAAHAAYLRHGPDPDDELGCVVFSHAELAHAAQSLMERCPLDESDRVVHQGPVSLGTFVREVCWPLAAGATIVLAPQEARRDPASLAATVRRTGATTLYLTPTLLAALSRDDDAVAQCAGLRRVLCGEEPMPGGVAHRFRALTGIPVHHLYGVATMASDVLADECPQGSAVAPLGSPTCHTGVYVLDVRLHLAPEGVAGEVYVRGAGLARGASNRPAPTASRFVACPFGPPGARMYRTGDLARWRADGRLEFVGRTDQLVRIRGVSADPFAVEAVLCGHPGVAQAAVVAQAQTPGDAPQLTAYVVPVAGGRLGAAGEDVNFAAGLDVVELRRFAAATLPDQLVPTTFVVLESLPSADDGRRDTGALPEPHTSRRAHRAPGSPQEKVLADAFAEVLGAGRIGADDDFFALGGDSISAMRVVALARAGGLALTARTVFECRTVAALAAAATPAEETTPAVSAARSAADEGPIPLPPMARLFAERGPGLDRLAQWLVLTVPAGLRPEVLTGAVQALVDRHDVLRSRLADGELVVHPREAVDAATLIRRVSCPEDVAGPALRALLEEEAGRAVAQLSASAGVMVRFVWCTAGDQGPARLLVAAHHLVVDGMSWRILVPDLAQAVEQLTVGRAPALAPVATSMASWMAALAEEAARPARVQELGYWRGVLEPPVVPVGSRPLDPGVDTTASAQTLSVELPPELSTALLTEVPTALRCGVDDLLLTALVLALAERNGADRVGAEQVSAGQGGARAGEVVVRLEGHGRQEDVVPGVDLTRTVGWFTTVHPVRLDVSGIDVEDALSGGPAVAEVLRHIKERRRALPDQGLGYSLLRHLNEETATRLRSRAADEVGFNYLGRFTFAGAGGEAPWTPAPELPVLVPAPDPEAPLVSALECNALVAGTERGERLQGFFTFATGLLRTEEVRRIADTWQRVLRGLHAQATRGASGLTPSDVSLVEVRQRDLDDWQRRFGQVADVWPLTPLQRGLLYHSMLGDGAAASYQTQFVFRIEGPVAAVRLRTAAQTLLDRHPNLRAAFVTTFEGEAVQVVVDGVEVPFVHTDLTDVPDAEGELGHILVQEREDQFRPDAAPLLRFRLVTLSPTRAELALTAHHVLFDGWSLPLIEQELMHLYAGGGADLEPVEHGYRDFLRWQSGQDTDRALEVWAGELSGVTHPTLLAGVLPHAKEPAGASQVGQLDVPLTREESSAVARRAAECGITPNILVQGAWAVVLGHLTAGGDVLFGSSVTVRPPELPHAHSAVGMFTNTVPVRAGHEPLARFDELLRSLQDAQARTLEHQHVGLGEIQRAAGLPTLFDTIVVFESFPVNREALSRASASAELTVTGIRPYAPTHYPLTVLAAADPMVRVTLQFHPDVLDERTVGELADRLSRVLRQFLADPHIRVAALDLLSGAERRQVVEEWNATELAVPPRPLPEQFARQAGATPHAIALETGEQRLTYTELNERANRMAHWLIAEGVDAEDRVVVSLPRTADLVAALLAVGKAGGCYVPVDPDHPAERTRAVIEDCAAVLVLDEKKVAEADLERYPTHDPGRALAPEQAAYTLYTSGSTGAPKGVVVSHGALTNFLTSMARTLPFSAADCLAAVTTVTFDIAALELFLPLTTGGRVVLADRRHTADPSAMLDLVERSGVTVLQATPALWQMLVTHDVDRLAGLRVLTGGEALPLSLAEQLTAHAAQVTNVYGPTETTIWSTYADVTRSRPPSIGTPLANTQVLVLDSALRPVPPGVGGDLWIAGDGLARGYHRQPGPTATRFVANPFGPPGARMYRTGDLARWSRSGEVEFLGRADFQIKLRGFRIEPGEIEHALLRHPAVGEAVVTVWEEQPGDKRLTAYLVPADDAEQPSARELQRFLRERLPEYMIPSAVVALPALPLTPNGKLDRARLPKPEAGGARYRAPESPREVALCGLFAEVLGVERVGIDDDFFALGGHSLLATRLAARVRSELGVEIPIRTLFAAPTVAELARHWGELSTTVRKPLRKMTES